MDKEEKKAIELLKQPPDLSLSYYKREHAIDIVLNLIEKQQKEIEEYKRYFKLAISDLQSEGYMQMPYENIEKYYSKREDIV